MPTDLRDTIVELVGAILLLFAIVALLLNLRRMD